MIVNIFFDFSCVIIGSVGVVISVKKKFIESALTKIKQQKKLTSLEEKKLRYGLEAFYNLATKTIVLIILAIVFDLVIELLLLALVYSTLRLYGFGIHAKTSLQCWFTTIPIYMLGGLFIKYATITSNLIYIFWIISFLSFLLFAPADTPARPLIRKNKRIRAKILSVLILCIYFIIYTLNISSMFNNVIIYAICMELIVINPLTYKLTKTPFHNYEIYEKNMV